MAQYIDKSTLVAEIKRRRESNAKERYFGRLVEDNYFLDFLDSLEVKEVDLDEEIEKCLKLHSMLAVGKKDFTDIAHHFFELGMQVSNKAQKGEKI